jgi:UDP-sugar transporter A1/2/3
MTSLRTQQGSGRSIQLASLLTLTIQNSMLVLVLRYSQTFSKETYFTTTAVFLCEVLKSLMSLALYYQSTPSPNIMRDIFSENWYLLAVPATLYTIQNNLQFTASSILDAATFQVTYQLKILTTALCSVWLLKRSLSSRKWFSLFILTCGVVLVQFPSSKSNPSDSSKGSSHARLSDHEDAHLDLQWTMKLFGLFCVFTACVISGLAGVYFEKILKESRTSLWVRNMQLSIFSLIPAILGMIFKDSHGISTLGFWYGYSKWAWAAIWCQALGGLLVSVVVKYCDNILKGFATSISIILSTVMSIILFNFEITWLFFIGASLVIAATFLYGMPDPRESLYEKLPIGKEIVDRKYKRIIVPHHFRR